VVKVRQLELNKTIITQFKKGETIFTIIKQTNLHGEISFNQQRKTIKNLRSNALNLFKPPMLNCTKQFQQKSKELNYKNLLSFILFPL